MIDDVINLNPTGNDVIKGGVFFGSNLTPSGSFSNIPQYIPQNKLTDTIPSLMLTLKRVKDSINLNIQQSTGATSTSNATLEKYLYDFVNLLIDYRDLRNYVFYGSANTEIAYNINYLVDNYPYNTLVAQPNDTNFIQLNNYIEDTVSKTEILFPETYYYSPTNFVRIIMDNFNNFNFFDDSNNFNWNNYQVVDRNGRRYNIERVVSPFSSATIFNVVDISNITITTPVTYNTIQITTGLPHGYLVGQSISFVDLLCVDRTVNLNYTVQVFNGIGFDTYEYPLNNTEFVIDSITSTTFTIRRLNGNAYENITVDTVGLIPFYDNTQPGIVRLWPAAQNTRPFGIKIIIEGNLTNDALLNFDIETNSFNGFLISPQISVINDWSINLTPIQNQLLAPAPINPTPWPRRPITNNIMNILTGNDAEDDYVAWINNPTTLYVQQPNDPIDVDAAWSPYGLQYEINLVRALALDETETNQLLRRCIPAGIISELNDTEDFYFQRFILIAGWLFDQIRLYVKFIKYAHTIDYQPYNQLSPDYYRYLANYWGLDLFDDDNIDFSQLVIQTVLGEYFGLTATQIQTNRYYQQTLQQVQNARQKNLLLSLIYLYKQKGVQNTLKKIVSLLGGPDGFLDVDEYAFQVNNLDINGYPINGYNGVKIIDNDKVHVPNFIFEIDPNYLIDKINVNNPVNKPYVYKKFLNNEYTYNLREISVLTNPNGAIDYQIENYFGNQKYNYITFGKGEFSNLQKVGNYFMLPLSIPDRFFGMSLEYMIPVDGMAKGIGSDQEEAVCDVFSLYKLLDGPTFETYTIANIIFDTTYTVATITTVLPNGYSVGNNIFIANTMGVNNLNDNMFVINSIIDTYSFTIGGDFGGVWLGGGQVVTGSINELNNPGSDSLQYTYPLAIRYRQRNRTADTAFAVDNHGNPIVDGYTNPSTDFNILQLRYPSSTYIEDAYIITRMEGNDLIVRLRLQSETTGAYGERIAIFENIFMADGLNHSLRMLLREDGIEIYKDYYYMGIAKWMNISSAGPYKAYEIPKSEIKALLYATDDCTNFYESINVDDFIANPSIHHTGLDTINWWDLFIGMPDNVEFYFKKLNFFDNDTVNDFNIGDRMTDSNNDTAEFYVFEITNPIFNSILQTQYQDFNIPAVFYEMFPNSIPTFYGYVLPQTIDQYNRKIVTDLTLTNKRCYDEIKNALLINYKQDFFKFVDVFANNAWMWNIHKSYAYDSFNEMINTLYALYSNQVLTYSSLLQFMQLIEQKFKSTFQSFIPMVVNIDEFGRLITNSLFSQAKMRIPGNDKVCTMQFGGAPSIVYTPLFKKSFDDTLLDPTLNFDVTLQTVGGGIVLFGPDTVTVADDEYLTMCSMRDIINAEPVCSSYNIVADVYANMIRVSINYDLFFSAFGVSSNTLQLKITQGINTFYFNFDHGTPAIVGTHSAILDSCGAIVIPAYNDTDVCGSITYLLPALQPHPVYTYFATEEKPPTSVYFSTEVGEATPVIVYFSTE